MRAVLYYSKSSLIRTNWERPTTLLYSEGATVREGPWPLFLQFLNHTQLVGLLGWRISRPQGQRKHRINRKKYPGLEWTPNP
jgi:hypothetical protein